MHCEILFYSNYSKYSYINRDSYKNQNKIIDYLIYNLVVQLISFRIVSKS